MALVIKLVRHAESEANTGSMDAQAVGDHVIPLSKRGWQQAREVGVALGGEFLRGALVYCSPYRRTRETLAAILDGAGLTAEERAALMLFEDPRLREVDHGYESVAQQETLRRTHGWFYYRFRGGESPADCFDRTSSFMESMIRQTERKQVERVLIITHGLTLRCFVMRFLHMTVEEFDELGNPENCAVVTVADRTTLDDPSHTSGYWGVQGLTKRGPPDR